MTDGAVGVRRLRPSVHAEQPRAHSALWKWATQARVGCEASALRSLLSWDCPGAALTPRAWTRLLFRLFHKPFQPRSGCTWSPAPYPGRNCKWPGFAGSFPSSSFLCLYVLTSVCSELSEASASCGTLVSCISETLGSAPQECV